MVGRFLSLGCLLFSLSSIAFESASTTFSSKYSGHEEITRQALNHISRKLNHSSKSVVVFDLSEINFDLQPEPHGLIGEKSKNLLIHGNFASDFPNKTSVLDLGKFWGIKDINNFQSEKSQVLHFLRNYTNSKMALESAYSTCVEARSNIKHLTAEALKAWTAGNKTKALFLLGHATHTIQDSFSTAHTRRADDSHNNDLLNVCFFGADMATKINYTNEPTRDQVCYHTPPDSKDAIWITHPGQLPR